MSNSAAHVGTCACCMWGRRHSHAPRAPHSVCAWPGPTRPGIATPPPRIRTIRTRPSQERVRINMGMVWRVGISFLEGNDKKPGPFDPGFDSCDGCVSLSCRGTSAASLNGSDASASSAPSPRSGGCVRASPRIADRLLPACGRCSCRCRSACATRAPRAA